MANWGAEACYIGKLYNQAEEDAKLDLFLLKEDQRVKTEGREFRRDWYTRPTLERHDYTESQQDLIRRIQFTPEFGGCMINQIKTVGPAVLIGGSGKWGAGIPFTAECWTKLCTGIVVHESWYEETLSRAIIIDGKSVYSFQEHCDPMTTPPGWDYVPVSQEEVAYLSQLFPAIKRDNDREYHGRCWELEQERAQAKVDDLLLAALNQ